VSEESKGWAGSSPSLVGLSVEFDAYVSLAATFTAFSAGGALPDEVLRLVDSLISDSDVVRDEAVEHARALGLPDQRALVQTLLVRVSRLSAPERAIEAVVQVAETTPSLGADVAAGIRDHAWAYLGPVDVVPLAESRVPEIRALVEAISRDQTLDDQVRMAAQQMLNERTGR
jgi:hypothetical protein